MRTILRAEVAEAIKIDRRQFRRTEESFASSPVISDIARLLWPKGTAAEIASRAGCSVRNAELYLSSGPQKWSGDAIAVIIAEIMRRHLERE
jgi:predicted regulator of amino acid metabolism with ACT domain